METYTRINKATGEADEVTEQQVAEELERAAGEDAEDMGFIFDDLPNALDALRCGQELETDDYKFTK